MDASQITPHFINNSGVISGPPTAFIASMESFREYNFTLYSSNDFAPSFSSSKFVKSDFFRHSALIVNVPDLKSHLTHFTSICVHSPFNNSRN